MGFTAYQVKQAETKILSETTNEETGEEIVKPELVIRHTLSDVPMVLPTRENYDEFHQKLGMVDFVTGKG